MGKKVTWEFEIPSLRELVDRLQNKSEPIDSPSTIVNRFSNALFMLNVSMSLALLTVSRDDIAPNPIAQGSVWREVYAGAFAFAGLLGIIHFVWLQNFSREFEFRFRMVMFGTAFIAALGWLLITTATALMLGADWTRPVPWVFIIFYLTRIFRTYITYDDQDTIEKIKRTLPDA